MAKTSMLRKIGRLFVIKTRLEAWFVIYAIALGAVERGIHYRVQYPGAMGWLLAAACTGVVFIAGAKLLDSVKKPQPAVALGPYRGGAARRPMARRNRPTAQPRNRASRSRISRHKD